LKHNPSEVKLKGRNRHKIQCITCVNLRVYKIDKRVTSLRYATIREDNMKKLWLISWFLLLTPCMVHPQKYTEILDEIWGMGRNYSVPAFCDIDKDGLLDLIVGSQDGDLTHYRQNAAGSSGFTLITNHFNQIDVGEFATPCFLDLDQDGLLDLLIGSQYGDIKQFEQEAVGSLHFNRVTNQFNGIKVQYGSAPCITDLDDDGLLDMIVAERAGNLNYYRQNAVNSAHFTLVEDTLSGIVAHRRPRPIFLDLDQDNLMDLIIGGSNGSLLHYEQDAPGSFTFSLMAEQFSTINIIFYSAPWFVDLNNDGILDLIVGDEAGFLSHYAQDAKNSLSFHLITEEFITGIIDVGLDAAPAVADWDNNGLLDLLIGTHQGVLYYYSQNTIGSSLFTRISSKFADIDIGGVCATPILTDINHNGLYDLIVGGSNGNMKYYEQEAVGSTAFQFITDTLAGINVGSYSSPSVVDLDGDGLLDLVVGDNEGRLRHFEQDSVGSFDFVWLSDSLGGINVGDRSSPCFTDLDDDGLLDLIVGNRSTHTSHYEQDAPGSTSFIFITEFFNDVYISAAKPVFVDVNGDGKQDYLAGSYYGDIRYFQRIDETFIEQGEISVTPQSFALFQNYPNPFNSSTTIHFDLPRSTQVDITVYNTLGQSVKTLLDNFQHAGSHEVRWDGKDEKGFSAPIGIYICRMKAEKTNSCFKFLLIK